MKLTESHIRFWIQHRGPSFVQKFYQEKLEESKKKYFAADPRVDINDLIPPHKRMTESEVAISNLLGLCRSYRKRGELTQNLARIAVNPGTIINPKKRAALAKKWLNKIMLANPSYSI